jgi:hypothetical protein
MTKAAYPLKLPNSIKQAAQRLAKEDGVSLNQWISSAVAQKVGSVETAAEFFRRRAVRAKGNGLMHFLVNAPDVSEEAAAESDPVRVTGSGKSAESRSRIKVGAVREPSRPPGRKAKRALNISEPGAHSCSLIA